MHRLAVELLDLSRLEAGALELRPEPTDVGQLAREVAAEFTPAPRATVRRHARPQAGADRARVRPRARGQVLRILLDNALRHTPPGTGVRVSAAATTGTFASRSQTAASGSTAEHAAHLRAVLHL